MATSCPPSWNVSPTIIGVLFFGGGRISIPALGTLATNRQRIKRSMHQACMAQQILVGTMRDDGAKSTEAPNKHPPPNIIMWYKPSRKPSHWPTMLREGHFISSQRGNNKPLIGGASLLFLINGHHIMTVAMPSKTYPRFVWYWILGKWLNPNRKKLSRKYHIWASMVVLDLGWNDYITAGPSPSPLPDLNKPSQTTADSKVATKVRWPSWHDKALAGAKVAHGKFTLRVKGVVMHRVCMAYLLTLILERNHVQNFNWIWSCVHHLASLKNQC